MERLTYTIQETSELLGLSKNTTYQLARTNSLGVPVIRLGKRMVVSKAGLERLLNQGVGVADGR